MTAESVRVLSVVGPGRSGTTILGNILGEVSGITNAGELRWLWRRGVTERRPCGCGRPPAECPRWSLVLTRLLGEHSPPPDRALPALVGEFVEAQDEMLARRNRIRAISAAAGPPADWPALRRVRSTTVDVCTHLAEVTGAGLIVDTSKTAEWAAVLAGAPGIEHYVLHVVRDPRAVAFSWRRPKPLPLAGGLSTMATQSALTSAGFWVESCVGADLLRRHVPPERWMFLRYEDFIAQPRATVQRVLSFLGVSADGPFTGEHTVSLGVNHTLAGNPNRFLTGPVSLIEDDEWRQRMAPRDRAVVSLATLPWLLRYGYRPLARQGRRSPWPTIGASDPG